MSQCHRRGIRPSPTPVKEDKKGIWSYFFYQQLHNLRVCYTFLVCQYSLFAYALHGNTLQFINFSFREIIYITESIYALSNTFMD